MEPRVFADLGAGSGMTVLGPPLVVSDPPHYSADTASTV